MVIESKMIWLHCVQTSRADKPPLWRRLLRLAVAIARVRWDKGLYILVIAAANMSVSSVKPLSGSLVKLRKGLVGSFLGPS